MSTPKQPAPTTNQVEAREASRTPVEQVKDILATHSGGMTMQCYQALRQLEKNAKLWVKV